ncbi:MAG: Rrf2 family transcriptional regulator [Solimonas sp.]
MKRNERLSVALHVLLHMAEHPDVAMTSGAMAACADTHPVVIRRTFAGLREAGIVSSVKGHGGGWRLARPLSAISLDDVQRALDERVMSVALDESPGCLVEQAVQYALDGAVAEATRVLDARLAAVSLADIAADVRRRDIRRHGTLHRPPARKPAVRKAAAAKKRKPRNAHRA